MKLTRRIVSSSWQIPFSIRQIASPTKPVLYHQILLSNLNVLGSLPEHISATNRQPDRSFRRAKKSRIFQFLSEYN